MRGSRISTALGFMALIIVGALVAACGSHSSGAAPTSVERHASAIYGYEVSDCRSDGLTNQLDAELGDSSAHAYNCGGYGVILFPGGGGVPYDASSDDSEAANGLTGPVIAAKIRSELRTKSNQQLRSANCGQRTGLVAGDTVQCKVVLPSGGAVDLPALIGGGSGRFTVTLGSPDTSSPSSSGAASNEAPAATGTETTKAQAEPDTSMDCKDSTAPGIRMTTNATTCAKAEALLVALPENPLGHQSVKGWSCNTQTRGGQTTCALDGATVTFSPDSGDANSCPGSINGSAGNYAATSGGYFTDITATGLSCASAEAVIASFGQATRGKLISYSNFSIIVGGLTYACDGKVGQPSGDPDDDLEEKFSCVSGAQSIAWIAPSGD